MLVNLTNHPSASWGEIQKNTAIKLYGSIVDIPFPHINPMADEIDIKHEAKKYLEQILNLKPNAVHVMGEMNFTFQMVYFLMQQGIECVASTTKRIVEDLPDGSQKSQFEFISFRKYNFLIEENLKINEPAIVLNKGQKQAFDLMTEFLLPRNEHNVFILKGYAGTGKTTLLKNLIAHCNENKLSVSLMASTGRAATVLRNKTKNNSSTVHSLVYKFDEIKQTGDKAWDLDGKSGDQLFLNFQTCKLDEDEYSDVYIIDEASMISGSTNKSTEGTKFGSGNLLTDFLSVIGNSKVIFVGDTCQLPPVDESSFSAALEKKHIQDTYSKKVMDFELTEIQRQGENSEILEIAKPLREQILAKKIPEWPKLSLRYYFKDVKIYETTHTLIQKYLSTFHTHGSENCILVTHSNLEAFNNNKEIRKSLFPNQNTIQKGDLIMIIKNCMLTGLKNGDQAVIQEIESKENRAGLVFIQVKLKDINSGVSFDTLLVENLLNSAASALDNESLQKIYIDFDQRMRKNKITRNSKEYKLKMKQDVYLNAIHAKYGYSITLQKAQGGEWLHVFLNITKSVYVSKFEGYPENMLKWFYTAITRTQKYLYLNQGSWIKIN
jgi:hypothetical protein